MPRPIVLALLGALALVAPARADKSLVAWQPWSNAQFERAAREDRYILLHMAAVWCHWCHVMERTTYRDSDVLALIAQKFIPVRVDQDADPALAARYENYGWPGTIILDKDGNEILRRRGYWAPAVFELLLQAVIEDPSALPPAASEATIDPSRVRLQASERNAVLNAYWFLADTDRGGFGDTHRFILPEALEYALHRAAGGEAGYRQLAVKTLVGARRLIDPVWGGMYQYSDALDWSSPHYEKIMSSQLAALRTYSLAHGLWGDPADLKAAQAVAGYLLAFMRSPEGAFHASQDADLSPSMDGHAYYQLDDAARRALGQPAIDRNLYARENGWAIAGLATLYDQSGEAGLLAAAMQAADWALANRRVGEGGFRHGGAADENPVLVDNIAMAEAFLALHRSTGERRWLDHAIEAGRFIATSFHDARGGFMVAPAPADALGVFAKPVRHAEENVAATRFFNLLAHYTGEAAFRAAADHGMGYLAAIVDDIPFQPGALMADGELAREPAHVTIVGPKDDPRAQALYAEARRYPARYLRIEWWDRREGPLANSDVQYPELDEPAAFACANKLCSLPVFATTGVPGMIRTVDRR